MVPILGQSTPTEVAPETFGVNVFNFKTMRNYLSERAFQALSATLVKGKPIDASIADEVADAMKTWALEKGATHFTHWFLPLSGTTAEKHESFFCPDGEGGALARFSGRELTQGEPDASSFPSGGLRATFEARGYTAWDPTSPAFVKETAGVCVLYIPTIFCGYHGEALDKKTPLLRSQHALAEQVTRMARLFGIEGEQRVIATLGAEQEYFLVDLEMFRRRPDLQYAGRTLFGCPPPRHQQMEDHYFGHVKPRVLAFMAEVDAELWKLGVPAKMRHNEAAPSQFEIAPVFEEQNLAVDHNMLTMLVLQEVAVRHHFVCLLHEKPFAGLNGSGKHNNWSFDGPDGKNWLTPGNTPHDNAKFIALICAIMLGVDEHADLLRATVASAGNDQRLGGHEAPPCIMSIFLGEQLADLVTQIEKGGARSSKAAGTIKLGVSCIPPLPRDVTDRNRTSPLAFTGNKFEFRAVGANQSCAGPNVAMNTVVAHGIDRLCTSIEKRIRQGKNFNDALQATLREIVRRHKRILFDGDNYADEWSQEAQRRGLTNEPCTPRALEALQTEASILLFERYGVLSRRELKSRYDIYRNIYHKSVLIETDCALRMLRTMILPAALRYDRELQSTELGPGGERLAQRIHALVERAIESGEILEQALEDHSAEQSIEAMRRARQLAEELELLMPADKWPLPTYAEMLLLV